jgi:hypothetical protein
VRRPPLYLVLVALFVLALGETSGALMTRLRPELEQHTRSRMLAKPAVHGLAGSAEYDAEVVTRTVFTVEAGWSFFHTHAEGMALVTLLAGTVAASLGSRRRVAVVHALLAAGALFPLGYAVYAVLVTELGRETGIELAEQYVLTPLGAASIVGLLALGGLLVAAMVSDRRRGSDRASPG